KGLFFVAVTATLLYALLRRALADLAGLEAARREMERVERFSEALIDSLPGVLYLYDESRRFRRWNAAFERVTGYAAEEIARMHPGDFFAEADRPLVEARIAEVFATGASTVQAPFRAKDGTLTPYFFTGHRIEFDGRQCLVGVGIDVSAQERAAQELRRHAELLAEQGPLLRIAGRAARLGGWTLDLPAHTLRWSDEVCLMHDRPVGYAPTLAEGLGHFLPDDRPAIVAAMERCEREGTPYDLELRKRTATGREIWVRTIGEAVRGPDGRVVRLQGAFQDITERKVAELRIREQAALLDKAQDAIVLRDLDDEIRYWNKSAERLYGWTAEEASGRRAAALFY
ncbi:MAG TPA: PAS domain S-box protein, partial [Gemmatimonadales bacterium]|nr:PAS domain S-box protein [Gemmatimonadales bacterium]